MVNPLWVAVPVTILPAMAALWYFLRRYEGAFEDARVFFSLVVGFFCGMAAIAFEFVAFPFQDPQFVDAMGQGSAFAFFVAGYAFFETGIKVAVLGLRRFRKRRDTPYYGVAMGLGFGAMWALGFVGLNLNIAARPEYADYHWRSFLSMASVPLGGILAHGAIAAWVGKGSANGELWKGWLQGAFLQMPLLVAYWLFWPSIGRGDVVVLFPGPFALAYGIVLLLLAQRRVLDKVVPPELKDLLRKSRRRQQRRDARGDGAGDGDAAAQPASEAAPPAPPTQDGPR